MRMINLQNRETPQPMLKFGISRQRSELYFLTIFGEKRKLPLKRGGFSCLLPTVKTHTINLGGGGPKCFDTN